MKTLGEMRRELGYTQMEMAERVGVPFMTLCGWEQGRATPSMLYIKAIEEAYECDIHDVADFDSHNLDERRRVVSQAMAARRIKSEKEKARKAVERRERKARRAIEAAEKARREAERELAQIKGTD